MACRPRVAFPASKWIGPTLCLAAALSSGAFTAPLPIQLVRAKVPQAAIVLPPNPGETLQFAASELRKYVHQISGASLETTTSSDPRGTVGIHLALSEIHDSSRSAAIPDRYRVHVSSDRLDLTGSSERAVLFAVYDLLEQFGCRWLGPNEEFVPKSQTLEVPLHDRSEEPVLNWRGLELIAGITPSMVDWMAKSRLNVVWPESYTPKEDLTADEKGLEANAIPETRRRGLSVFWGGHVLPLLFPASRYGDSHPEYFALVGGKRLDPEVDASGRWQLCTSNPEVMRILCENVIQFLRNHPWIDTFFLWANDTTQWCECEACRQLEPEPDRKSPFGGLDRSASYCRMVKIVSDSVQKALPGRRIAFNHYYNLENLPTDREGKVLEEVLPGGWLLSAFDDYHQCDRHPFTDPSCPCGKRIEPIASLWGPRYQESISWSYYFAWNFTMGLPVSLAHKIPEDFRFIQRVGASGVVDNVSLHPGSLYTYNNLVNYQVYAKAAWNPLINVEGVLDDFATTYYGPAAGPMRRFWSLSEESWSKFGREPGFMPEDARLADPKLLHGRTLDAMNAVTPEAPSGSIDPRFLIPNREIYHQMVALLDEAHGLAAQDPNFSFRVDLLWAVIQNWDPAARPPYRVWGFLNGGGNLLEYLYRGQVETTCSVAGGGGGKGDCFPLDSIGVEPLKEPGDSVTVAVKINYGPERIGEPTYRSGPGLYQSEDQKTPCGQPGSSSVMFFIGNQETELSGARQVIVLISEGSFQTEILSSADNTWDYGDYVPLKIDYLGETSAGHTYRYSFQADGQWKEAASHTFKTRLPFAAPMHRWAGYYNGAKAKFPLIDWATIRM